MSCACERSASHPALATLPPDILWAWERKEDLRWLPAAAGVAYVQSSITLEGNQVRIYPRANPMYVRPETVLVPMVHVDAAWKLPPALNAAQKAAIVEEVLKAAGQDKVRVVQLDFEVRRSQREFLTEVVQEIRRRLPPETALSMTALASWCAGDYWLGKMPADEIVPMVFRMGRDGKAIQDQLSARGNFQRDTCTNAVGQSTDEPIARTSAPRHYFFSPRPWTQEAWLQISNKK